MRGVEKVGAIIFVCLRTLPPLATAHACTFYASQDGPRNSNTPPTEGFCFATPLPPQEIPI